MSNTLIDKETHELTDDITIVVEKHADYDCEFSDGEFTDKFSEFVIDRVDGIFYGEHINSDQCPLCAGLIPTVQDEDYNEDGTLTTPCPHCSKVLHNAEYNGYWTPDGLDADEIQQPYRILAVDLGRTCHDPRRNYRYYKPSRDMGNIGTGEMDHKPEYVLQEWNRAEQLNNGYWSYMGIIVKIKVDGETIGRSSGAYGIESDMDDSELAGIIEEELGEAWADALKAGQRVARVVAVGEIDASEIAKELV